MRDIYIVEMSKEEADQAYIDAWELFSKTDPRGFAIQQRLDKERADQQAVRDSLLNDKEYQAREFGSRLMNTLGFINGGTHHVAHDMSHMCDTTCIDRKDPAFGAKMILKAAERVKSAERLARVETRDGWEPEMIASARNFIKKCRKEKAKLSPTC